MKVPLAYASKNKWLARLREDPNLTKKVAVTLLVLVLRLQTYHMTQQKLNSIQKFKKVNSSSDGKSMSQQYMHVPYNMDFELFVMAKNSDDALQIVEQILPFFQPDYTVTLNDNSTMGTTRDVPIVLTNVNYSDEYEGDFVTRRSIIYTLSFTSKFYLYGHVTDQKVIKTVQVDQYTDMLSLHLRENRDILLHQIQVQMQTMILDLMKQPHSSKTQRTMMKQLVQTKMMHKYYKGLRYAIRQVVSRSIADGQSQLLTLQIVL